MDNQMAALLIRQLEAIRQELKAQTTVIAQREDGWTPDVRQAVDLADSIAAGVEIDLAALQRYLKYPAHGPDEGDRAALDDKEWHPPKVMS